MLENFPLWEHQKKAIKDCLDKKEFGLFFETGTGKTRTLIEIYNQKCEQEGRPLRALVFAPPVVLSNWKSEFLKYYGKQNLSKESIFLVNKDGKYKKAKIQEATKYSLEHSHMCTLIVTNYETVQNDDCFLDLIANFKPEFLVLDESHRVKNFKSKRAKKIMQIADQKYCLYKFILTATPALQNALDLWMQFRILDGGFTFGKNFWSFRGRYFQDINSRWAGKPNYFPKWLPIEGMQKELADRISTKSAVAIKSECLDLPPLVRMRAEVELSAEQKRVYHDLAKEFVADVKDLLNKEKSQLLVTELAIEKALRMQQVLTGFIPLPKQTILEESSDIKEAAHRLQRREVIYFPKNPRAQALESLLEDICIEQNQKCIVWACFAPNYKTIADVCDGLGLSYAELHGGKTGEAREMDIVRFRKDDKCKVLIANQQAGGVGINLIEASYAIYYSRNFSLEADLQSEARNYRGGSEIHQKITRIDLVAPNTLDDIVLDALANKKMVGEFLLHGSTLDMLTM